jgi:hypothetical protein
MVVMVRMMTAKSQEKRFHLRGRPSAGRTEVTAMLSERILAPVLRFVTWDAFQLEKAGAIRFPDPKPDRRHMLYIIHVPFSMNFAIGLGSR